MREQYRKTIYFSSKKVLDVVGAALSKIAEVNNISESLACENILVDHLLPKNVDIKSECEQVWKGEMSTIEALGRIFLHLSNLDENPDNLEELVSYLQSRLVNVLVKEDDKYSGDWEYFRVNAYQVYKFFEAAYPDEVDKEIPVYQSKVKFAKFVIDSTKDLSSFRPIHYTNVILNSWDIVRESKDMVKSLYTLCELVHCNDASEDVVKFMEIINRLSLKWIKL